MDNTQHTYFVELKLALQKAGYTVQAVEDGLLPIEWNDRRLCQVTESSGIRFRTDDTTDPAAEVARGRVADIAGVVREYMTLIEQAPDLKADGLGENYKLLAEFNGAVLAGHPGRYGVEFVTWEWSYGRTGLWQGHYYDPGSGPNGYLSAKQDFCRAMYALGKLYLEEDDLPTALRWFQQSAELGDTLAQYRLGKLLLESGDADRNAEAVRWLTGAAERGNQYAQYALGKLYLLGRQVPPDHDAAVRWLEQSAAQGNESARATLEWMKHLRGPSVLSAATRLLHHMSRIFQEQTTSGSIASIRFTDSKLCQRIREKKIAMGHKPDDHEDQDIRMS